MKQQKTAPILVAFCLLFLAACNYSAPNTEEVKGPKLKETDLTYQKDSLTMKGYLVYDENKEGKRPAILVVHEWWGLNDYSKRRARELAELGYIALAVDLYGNGQQADNPKAAAALATPFYNDPKMAKARFDAALTTLKSYPQTDVDKIGGIGYCFGGSMLLNFARMGSELKGIVSFHGGLLGVAADKEMLKSKILVLHGAADQFVSQEEVAKFKHQMDSIAANYKFISYAEATHAFSNPAATATGQKHGIPIAYNPAADTASWKEMKVFFKNLFQE